MSYTTAEQGCCNSIIILSFKVRSLHHHIEVTSVALQSVYPEKRWLPYKFQNVPKGYWQQKSNVADALRHVKQHLQDLGYDRVSEVPYPVSMHVCSLLSYRYFRSLKMSTVLQRWGGLNELVLTHLAEPQRARRRSASKSEFHLWKLLKHLLPGIQVRIYLYLWLP